MKKILAITAIVMMPVIGHAYTSIIPLKGGVVAPLGEVAISLSNVLDGVSYKVECAISSDNKAKQDADYVKLYSGGMMGGMGVSYYINNMITTNGQGKFDPRQSNMISVEPVTRDTVSVTVRNLDDTDTITLSSCFATPSV